MDPALIDRGNLIDGDLGQIIRGMILNINLMQNYSDNSVTANSSLLSPTGGVNNIPPIQQNSMKNGYDDNNGYGNSYENKCATNYSIITNIKWNDVNNNMQLTKHDTNDDVDTLHLHFNGRVAHTSWLKF